jgi:hypothetical protein
MDVVLLEKITPNIIINLIFAVTKEQRVIENRKIKRFYAYEPK